MLRLRLPPGYEAERRYIAGVVLGEFLGLELEPEPGERLELTDGERSLRLADVLFRTDPAAWLAVESLPTTPLERWGDVPVVYGSRLDDGHWRRTGELGVDVLGSAFFCLTRYEEAVLPDRDARGRFPSAASLAVREGFADRPLVDEYVDVLWDALAELWPRLERRPRAFRTLPSHDVDTVRTPLRWAAGDVLYRRDPALAARRLAGVARPGLDPAWCFDALMDESERRGLRSAFYFLADPSGPPEGADYRLDDPRVLGLLRRIHRRGHEIGLHAGYWSYDDPQRFRKEADALRAALEAAGVDQAELGGRQHWLRWANPVTWNAWEDAGLAYDSTLGWPDAVGFRSSCCREHRVFDLHARTPLALRERPLVVMDTAATRVGRPPGAADARRIARVRDECRRHGGDFTILWHNEWALARDQRRLYRQALG